MSKKLLAMYLTAILCATALGGCGGGEDASSTASAGGESASSAAPVVEEDYVPTFPIVEEQATFTAVTPPSGGFSNMDQKIWYQAYEEATNVKIEWSYWPDWETQIGVALAGNDLPDLLFNLYTGLDKPTTLQYGQQGTFVDYSQYMQYLPYLEKLMEQYPESRALVTNEDGSMYALPCYTETLTAFSGTVYYRTDMFEEAGIAEPTTTDELLDAVKKLQDYFGKDNPDFIAFQPLDYMSMDSHIPLLLFPSFGEEVDREFGASDGKTVTYNYISDQWRRTLEYMHELYNSGGFDRNIYSEDGTNARAVILANNCAITTFGTGYSLDNFESGNYDVDLLAPLTSEYQSEQRYPKQYNSRLGSFQISSKCEDIPTLVKWVNSLYASKEDEIADGVYGVSLFVGIEGETWNYDDETRQTYTINVPADYDGAAADYLTEFGMSDGANCIFTPMNSSSPGLLCKGVGTRDKLLPYSVSIFPKNYLSFTDEESEQLSEYYTDIQEYVNQSNAAFVTEGVTDDSWNTFVNEVNRMGIEEVLKVYQAAYDRYLAAVE